MDLYSQPLSRPDQLHLDAASGWIGLGDLASARDELVQISTAAKNHPAMILVQGEYHFAAKEWEELGPLAERMLGQFPELDFLWINRSYALHELKRTQEALDALLPAAEKFPKHWLIRYNLACYCAQLGRLPDSLEWLKKAVALAEKSQIKTMALADPDLKPLRDEILGL